MYAVLHRYRVRLGTVAEAAGHARRTLVPLLKQVPAFVAYYLLEVANDTLASMAVFETSEGAQAATRLLSDWFRSDWPAFRQIPPAASVGELLTFEGVGRAAGTVASESRDRTLGGRRDAALPERRSERDRRMFDRRMMLERRQESVPVVTDRRRDPDRRRGADRRSGLQRRTDWPTESSALVSERRRIAPPWRRREPFRSK